MLQWAIEFRDPVDNICRDHKFRHLEVGEDEWKAFTDLVDLLKVSFLVWIGFELLRTARS